MTADPRGTVTWLLIQLDALAHRAKLPGVIQDRVCNLLDWWLDRGLEKEYQR